MNLTTTEKSLKYLKKLKEFMAAEVVPKQRDFLKQCDSGHYPMAMFDELKTKARAEGLWNLFLPALGDDEPGTRMSNLEYAPLAEEMGRVYWSSEIFNCNPPDTGNMELLHMFGSDEQKKRWLVPLLNGEIRSVFSMTEPDVGSSDATNISTSISREGDEYKISGRKWFSSAALHPNASFFIVMGVTDDRETTAVYKRQSMIIVPKDTPGVRILRDLPILGHHMHDGICEIIFDDVRVPKDTLLGEEGEGFMLAQARLGPGRIHHCMRAIGQSELALELMCERALYRETFGRTLSEYSNIQDWIANSRMEIEQARLYTLRAAWMIDTQGNRAAATEVSAIKVVAAKLLSNVSDRAMQVYGGGGLTADTPLAYLYSWGRAFRFFDGPDEVHLRSIARKELKQARGRVGSYEPYFAERIE